MSDRMPESGFTVPLSATTADGSATQPDDYTQVDDTVTFGQSDFTLTDVGGQFPLPGNPGHQRLHQR